MNKPTLLDDLRTQYEAARQSTQEHADVESFQAIDARLRKAFRWLEKAITYLNGIKPAIDHRFDPSARVLQSRFVESPFGNFDQCGRNLDG